MLNEFDDIDELIEYAKNNEVDLIEYVKNYNRLIEKETERLRNADPIPENYKKEYT